MVIWLWHKHEDIPTARDRRDRRGVDPPELHGAVETSLPTHFSGSIKVWQSSPGIFQNKTWSRCFLHHLNLPIEAQKVRSSGGNESQTVILLLPSNLADIRISDLASAVLSIFASCFSATMHTANCCLKIVVSSKHELDTACKAHSHWCKSDRSPACF